MYKPRSLRNSNLLDLLRYVWFPKNIKERKISKMIFLYLIIP